MASDPPIGRVCPPGKCAAESQDIRPDGVLQEFSFVEVSALSMRAGKGWGGSCVHIITYAVTVLHDANWAQEEIQDQEVQRTSCRL